MYERDCPELSVTEGHAGLGGDETRRETLLWPHFPRSSSPLAAGGWQRGSTHQGVWLQKAAAAFLPRHLTSILSSLLLLLLAQMSRHLFSFSFHFSTTQLKIYQYVQLTFAVITCLFVALCMTFKFSSNSPNLLRGFVKKC